MPISSPLLTEMLTAGCEIPSLLASSVARTPSPVPSLPNNRMDSVPPRALETSLLTVGNPILTDRNRLRLHDWERNFWGHPSGIWYFYLSGFKLITNAPK